MTATNNPLRIPSVPLSSPAPPRNYSKGTNRNLLGIFRNARRALLQSVVEEAAELAGGADHARVPLALLLVEVAGAEQLREAEDRRQRCAQLVVQVRQHVPPRREQLGLPF